MNETPDSTAQSDLSPPNIIAKRPSAALILSGLSLVALFIALGFVTKTHPLGIDLAIRDGLRGQPGQEPWTQPLGTVTGVVSDVLGPLLPIVFGLVMLIAAWAAWNRKNTAQVYLFLKLAFVLLLCRCTAIIAKPLYQRERPRDYPDFSYPSGHVTSVTATAFVAVLVALHLARRTVLWVTVIMGFLTVIAALARLVLGVHWFTDTVGAVLGVLGIGLLAATALRLLPLPPALPADVEEGVTSTG